MGAQRTTIYLDEHDRHCLDTLKQRCGISTLSAALRFTIRFTTHAQEESGPLPPLQTRTSDAAPAEAVQATIERLTEDITFLQEQVLSTTRESGHRGLLLAEAEAEQHATQQEMDGLNQELQALSTDTGELPSSRPPIAGLSWSHPIPRGDIGDDFPLAPTLDAARKSIGRAREIRLQAQATVDHARVLQTKWRKGPQGCDQPCDQHEGRSKTAAPLGYETMTE